MKKVLVSLLQLVFILVFIFRLLFFVVRDVICWLSKVFPSVFYLHLVVLRLYHVRYVMPIMFLNDSILEIIPWTFGSTPKAVEKSFLRMNTTCIHITRVVMMRFKTQRTELQHQVISPLIIPDPKHGKEIIYLLRLHLSVLRLVYLLVLVPSFWVEAFWIRGRRLCHILRLKRLRIRLACRIFLIIYKRHSNLSTFISPTVPNRPQR